MSLAEVETGKRRVLALLHELDQSARGEFSIPSAEETYRFDIRLGTKSAHLSFHAETLEDLAHNGQVKARVVTQLKEALDSLKREP